MDYIKLFPHSRLSQACFFSKSSSEGTAFIQRKTEEAVREKVIGVIAECLR